MKTYLNLLPWKCRRAQLVRLRLAQWCLPWAVAGGLVLAACVATWDHWRTGRERLERLEQEYVPTDALLAEIRALGKRSEELRARQAVLAQLESPRPALTLLGLVSQGARDCQGRLRVEQLLLRAEGDAARAASPAPDVASSKSVTIKGIAADNLAVARFVLALRQSKSFDRVELKSSQEPPNQKQQTRNYQVECAY